MASTEQFQKIIDQALRDAEKIPCSQETYLEGLELMADELTQRVSMVMEEVEHKRETPDEDEIESPPTIQSKTKRRR